MNVIPWDHCEKLFKYIRETYSTVDNYIDNCKNLFNKCLSRLNVFKEKAGNIPLPPKPVLTRRGTWLKAAEYHFNNFQKIAEIIKLLESSDTAKCVKETKNLIENDSLILRCELDCVSNEFKIISDSITTLEKRNLEIIKFVEMMEILIKNFQSSDSDISKKLSAILKDNPGFEEISEIRNILTGKSLQDLFLI